MAQERAIFGRVSEKVLPIHRDSAAERLAKKTVLRGFALEALDTLGVGSDVYQVRDKIDALHPLKPKHWRERKTRSVPEVWQTLFMLQFEKGTVRCDPVLEIDPRSGKETGKSTFLWSRIHEEIPPPASP